LENELTSNWYGLVLAIGVCDCDVGIRGQIAPRELLAKVGMHMVGNYVRVQLMAAKYEMCLKGTVASTLTFQLSGHHKEDEQIVHQTGVK
jgi:hypothetical protein